MRREGGEAQEKSIFLMSFKSFFEFLWYFWLENGDPARVRLSGELIILWRNERFRTSSRTMKLNRKTDRRTIGHTYEHTVGLGVFIG